MKKEGRHSNVSSKPLLLEPPTYNMGQKRSRSTVVLVKVDASKAPARHSAQDTSMGTKSRSGLYGCGQSQGPIKLKYHVTTDKMRRVSYRSRRVAGLGILVTASTSVHDDNDDGNNVIKILVDSEIVTIKYSLLPSPQ